MTNKEATEIIKSECYVFNPLDFDKSTRINTALDMAIQALEQEPCEDAVNRQVVLDMMKTRMSAKELYKAVYDLPSVTLAPKKWKWIDNHNGTISCSCCYTWFYKDDRYSYMCYCPYCGAKMDSKRNELNF